MRFLITGTLLSLALLLGGSSCVSDSTDTDYANDLCKKLDECNDLAHVSVSECADTFTKALNQMRDSTRTDCETQIDVCLGRNSCDNFLACDLSICGWVRV